MNYKFNTSVIILLLTGLVINLFSCRKEEVPIVYTTPAVANKTVTSVTCGGVITDEGSGAVYECGICWSTGDSPAIEDNKTLSDSAGAKFMCYLSELDAGTIYYFRAFASNESGTGYGIVYSFRTLGKMPAAETLSPTSVNVTTATFNAEVNANYLPTSVFFEYGTTTNYGSIAEIPENPINGNSVTLVNVLVEGLIQGTVYHYRVKTINSLGTTYGNDVSFITKASDPDGNIYNVINIGDQIWMAENLKTTKYKDGKSIPNVTDGTKWAGLTTSAYCWYDNSINYKNVYGGLYNWYAVKTGKLCPTGWHVPSDDEWATLTDYLGGENVAGGKLKETGTSHWASPNTGASDESCFTALPGGCRRYDGAFLGITGNGNWRTSSEYSSTQVMYRYLFYYSEIMYSNPTNKAAGYSVRCLKD